MSIAHRHVLSQPALVRCLLLVASLSFAGLAVAGTTGTEFQSLATMLQGWAEGYLGRALAIAAFLAGAAIGFARGTAMPPLIGLVLAVVFAIGPGIINGLISGVI